MVEQVGSEFDALIRKLPPVGVIAPGDPEQRLPEDFDQNARSCGPARSGYVQAIQFEKLVALAKEQDLVIGLYFRPGDYVVKGETGIAVYPSTRADDEVVAMVQRAIAVGVRRTPAQDPEYAVRHLVEIAVRSLSPSTNDPSTAIAVINRLSSSLADLMDHSMPGGVFADGAGIARVVCPQPSHASLLKAAFSQIRQDGADKPVIVINLLEALRRIAEHAGLPEQRAALSSHVDAIEWSANSEPEFPADLESIGERVWATRAALARPD